MSRAVYEDDLISRQAAIISFEEVKETLKKSIDETTNINEALEKTVQFIYSKGYEDGSRRWRKKGTYTESIHNDEWYCRYATCNECGEEWMGSRNFCPNCGVKMDRKGGDE